MQATRVEYCVPYMPCAEIFFKCQETLNADGTGSMVDSIRGATYRPTAITGVAVEGSYKLINSPIAVPSNAIYPQCATSQVLTAGSWPNFKQRHIITIAIGRVVDTTARSPIGQGDGDLGFPGMTGGDVSLAMTNSMHTFISTSDQEITNPFSADPRRLPAAGTDVAMILEYSPGVSCVGKCIGVNGSTFGSGTTETIIRSYPTLLADINPGLNNRTRLHGLAFYSWSAFSFDNGLPSSRGEVYQWLMEKHIAGHRVLPPQWRNEVSSR